MYTLDSPENYRAVWSLNPADCCHSGLDVSSERGWTSKQRLEQHSWSLTTCSFSIWIKEKTDKVINNSNSCLLFHFHDHWWPILDSNRLLCKEINLIHKSNNWDISRNKSNPIEITLESAVYSLNSPEQHIAASMLNPSGGFHSDPALSDGKGWTSELRPQFHSELLRANS